MRIIGLDVGDKRIGVAVSDALKKTAQGVGVIQRKNSEDDINEIKNLAKEYEADLIVVGLPLKMDGAPGERAKLIAEFVEILNSALNIPVTTYDERLSTKEAEKFLISSDVSRKKRKRVVDIIAAQLILQSYLDRNR